MEDFITTDSITKWLTEQVAKKNPIGPEIWLDAAQKINVLLQDEQEELFELEQAVAKTRCDILEQGKSVSYAKVIIESTDSYKNTRKQKAKIERCLELIRISKLQSRMASEVMRGN